MLTNDDMLLRPYTEGDRGALVRLADNINVSKYLQDRFPSPYTLESADRWIALVGLEEEPLNLAIEWQGQLVGGIGSTRLFDIHGQTAEIGYWLGEPFWGKGLATRAVRLFADYAFGQLRFLRLQAMMMAENMKSARVLEKNGFIFEGRLRQHITKRGRIHDALLYAKTKQ
ncbi:MAG: GNAT family N-acetyltransferase [Holophagaceae bacterium]|nr:GNAT family N-acetyltransferase [Holophagaceae bacterium]